jgi:hypothetical protein
MDYQRNPDDTNKQQENARGTFHQTQQQQQHSLLIFRAFDFFSYALFVLILFFKKTIFDP